MYKKKPHRRYKLTLQFLESHISTSETILDLGVENPFTKVMKDHNYVVKNTKGEDLDSDTSTIENSDATVVTAFEIFEHLLSPYTVLNRHYHEFEDWQFDWLLEKAGWKIIDSKKWTHPTKKIGIRPILRWFTPRYYIVYAERIKNSKD